MTFDFTQSAPSRLTLPRLGQSSRPRFVGKFHWHGSLLQPALRLVCRHFRLIRARSRWQPLSSFDDPFSICTPPASFSCPCQSIKTSAWMLSSTPMARLTAFEVDFLDSRTSSKNPKDHRHPVFEHQFKNGGLQWDGIQLAFFRALFATVNLNNAQPISPDPKPRAFQHL